MKFTSFLIAFAALACVVDAAKGPAVTNKVYFDVTVDGKVCTKIYENRSTSPKTSNFLLPYTYLNLS